MAEFPSVKYFLDTEFIELPARQLHLISIALVCEDGREYYAINDAVIGLLPKIAMIDPWVFQNVVPLLEPPETHFDLYRCHGELQEDIRRFTANTAPIFWGDYASYDWYILVNLFGHMTKTPQGWPMHPYDLREWCEWAGSPQLPPQRAPEHHALNDARWNREVYDFLYDYTGGEPSVAILDYLERKGKR